MIHDARLVYTEPAGFTPDEIARILRAAAGMTVHFPSAGAAEKSDPPDLAPFLLAYARNERWQIGLPVSKRRFYQVLAAERKAISREKLLSYQVRSLTLNQLARLFGKSVPTVLRLLKGASDSPSVESEAQ